MMKDHYFINQFMQYMAGFYDRNGKTCTIVKEENRIFTVDKSPKEILDYSTRKVGFNLKGAMETSRSTLGNIHKCPILVNPFIEIYLFPTLSSKRDDAIWLNPCHIHRTSRAKLLKEKTKVVFNNGHIIHIDSRLSSFNTQLQNTEQYRKMTTEAGKDPSIYRFDPKNKKFIFILFLAVKLIMELMDSMGLMDVIS